MKRALSALAVMLLAVVAVGCGSSSHKTETSDGVAEPGLLGPRTPAEVRVREAEEHREEVEAKEKKEEEAREAQKKREEGEPTP